MDKNLKYLGFKIHYVANFGFSLYVLGNIPELGNWDVSKGLKMHY